MASQDSSLKSNPVWKFTRPFIAGGVAGIFATCCVQPIDKVKVRLQVAGEGVKGGSVGPMSMLKTIVKEEGFLSLYDGLSAGILRQVLYGSTRLGVNQILTEKLTEPGKKTTLTASVFSAIVAGTAGAVVGNPGDLILVRMQLDKTLPAEKRRNYRGLGHALSTVVKEEGAGGLMKGVGPTTARAIFINVGMLATFGQAKQYFKPYLGDTIKNSAASSFVAGFVCCLTSLPFDFIKTRVQKQVAGPDGKLPYSGTVDCFIKTVRNEGPLAVYKGFFTYYIRISPHVFISLTALDYINKYLNRNGF